MVRILFYEDDISFLVVFGLLANKKFYGLV